MRLNRFHHLSFALALLLGQLLTFAHGFEHRALAPEATCQLCVHAQGLDSGATSPAMAAAWFVASCEAPQAMALRRVPAPLARHHRARAPPVSLV